MAGINWLETKVGDNTFEATYIRDGNNQLHVFPLSISFLSISRAEQKLSKKLFRSRILLGRTDDNQRRSLIIDPASAGKMWDFVVGITTRSVSFQLLGETENLVKVLLRHHQLAALPVQRTSIPSAVNLAVLTLREDVDLVVGTDYTHHAYLVAVLYDRYQNYSCLPANTVINPDLDIQSEVVTLYIGSSLLLLGKKAYDQFITDADDLITSGRILTKMFSAERVGTVVKDTITMDRLCYQGFLGLASFAKSINKVELIREWINRRVNALFARMNSPAPLGITDSSFDVTILNRYWQFNPDVRSLIFKWFLYDPAYTPPGIDSSSLVYAAVKSQVDLVLTDIEMTTFKLCLSFAQACETEAHLIPEVVSQSRHVIRTWDALQEYCTSLPYGPQHYFVFNEREPVYELNKYPDLAYCAITHVRSLEPNSSWKNYNVGDIPTTVKTSLLCEGVSKRLKKLGTVQSASTDVKAYLQERGVDVDPEAVPMTVVPYSSGFAPMATNAPAQMQAAADQFMNEIMTRFFANQLPRPPINP